MPDLSDQLSAILQNPEAQQNIRNLLSSLGQENSPQNQNNGFDLSSLFSNSPQESKPESHMPEVDINMLMKLQKIFSQMNCDDQNVNLLRALKPHLHEPQKIDNAIHLLQIMSVLPALGESGIFGGGFR